MHLPVLHCIQGIYFVRSCIPWKSNPLLIEIHESELLNGIVSIFKQLKKKKLYLPLLFSNEGRDLILILESIWLNKNIFGPSFSDLLLF